MSKIEKIVIGKGTTRKITGTENDFNRKYLQLEITLPTPYTEESFHETVLQAEYLIDNWLEQEKTVQIPEFNPEDLVKHEWKGKKDGKGGYEKGSVAWGWDFKDKFSEEVIKALEKGPVTIDQYEFTLGETIVNAKKKR